MSHDRDEGSGGRRASELAWITQQGMASISSEGSDEPDELIMSDLDQLTPAFDNDVSAPVYDTNHLSPNHEVEFDERRRRSSRAPAERAGRIGVWDMGEVANELRNMAEPLWDLASRGEEHRIAELTLHEGVVASHTSLLIAAWHGLTGLTNKLLLYGASPTACDIKGRTPLHLACCAGADDCVALLIQAGANVNAWDATKRVTPLHCAAAAPSEPSVQLLLQAGANVDAGLATGGARSALHYAVQAGSAQIVQLLLAAGASPNTPQLFTETPLHVAAALGSAECVRLLLQRGADVRVQAGSSRATPLHLAAEDGNANCVCLLLDSGADPQAKNARQQTPLHLAALAQSAETLEMLLRRGGDPNSVDIGGHTPLHSAIVKGSRPCECVRLLVEHGADVNKADNYGYTPLHIAALSEFPACVELFIRHGGHVTARTNGGVSALSFMVRRTPDALRRFLDLIDTGITLHEHELGDVDCTLKLDFRVLVPRTTHGESELLLSFVEVGQRHLLQHPLCQTFLFLKWRQIRKFFLISLFFHAIFVILHTSFVMCVFVDTKTMDEYPVLIKILGYTLLAMNIILVSKEIFQIAHARTKYAKRWENWLQWLIVACVFVCVEALWTKERRPLASWQHHIAALGIFFTWVELMMLVGRFPIFGLYVQMFTTVAANFAKFLLAYSCLLIAFAFSFAVVFPQYPAFKSLPWVFLKTVVMMSGELEFENIFFDENIQVLYPVTAHLLFLFFTLLAAVVLMNLLVGLAVSDIQGLQRSAGLDRLVRQAELVSHIESILFSKLCAGCIPLGIVTFCHRNALLVTSGYRWALYIRPNDPRESRIPKELVEAAYRLVSSRSTSSKKQTNFGTVQGARNVSHYSTSSAHTHLDTSLLEHIRGQLGMLVTQNESRVITENTISQRVSFLVNQVEALKQEVNNIKSNNNSNNKIQESIIESNSLKCRDDSSV